MRRVVGLIAGLAGVLFALATLRLVRRYEVEGRSMLRAYAPGDRLLVEGLTYRTRPPRVGEAVVVRRTGRLDLKRIAAGPGGHVTLPEGERALGAEEWYVLGDNLTESTDSRQLGPVQTRDIVGRVWLKY